MIHPNSVPRVLPQLKELVDSSRQASREQLEELAAQALVEIDRMTPGTPERAFWVACRELLLAYLEEVRTRLRGLASRLEAAKAKAKAAP